MTSPKKIFFIIPPAFGHVNPVTGLANELVKRNHKVIFYGNQEQREIIEKTGAEFRLYAHPTFDTLEKIHVKEQDHNEMMIEFFSKFIDFSYIT